MESHEMRLQSQMPSVLVENVFEMLQHSTCLEDRFKRIIATINERFFKYFSAARSRRRSGAKVELV